MKRILCAVLALAMLLAGCGLNGGTGIGSSEPESEPETGGEPSEEEIASSEPSVDVDGEPDEFGAEETDPEAPIDDGPQILRLTVPEGYTLARIGMTLEDMEVCTVEEFIGAAQEGDFTEFPLIAALPADETRCFTLGGYLFPDTYEIYSNESPESIIRRMLTHTEQTIGPELRGEIEARGMSVEEAVILASIIQKESFGDEIMPMLSSVLHNRLDQGMQLQCDVTITYVEGAIKPFIDGDINRYNEYYNTYKCPALPAGPICNPGLPAIRAAVNPAESDYLFFVTDEAQNYLFAADYEEHLENVEVAGA